MCGNWKKTNVMFYKIGLDRVYEFTLDLPLEQLVDYSNRLEEQKAGQYTGDNRRSNYGGFQSFEYLYRQYRSHSGDLMINIFDNISNLIEVTLDPRYNYILNNYWFNINSPGSYNKLHDHLTPYKNQQGISGTFYIQVPLNSGNIIFVNEEIKEEVEIKSSPGKLLIFPSYLLHKVTENLSSSNRYSVAFNYDMELKPGNRSRI